MNRRRFLQHSAAVAMLPRNTLASLPGFEDGTSERFWQNIRNQFPLCDDRIYFNTGGLGPSPSSVLNTLFEKTREHDETGETGHEVFDKARKRIADFVGAESEEIAFTRNATEGMNIIARGIPLQAGDEVITTFHEHPGGAIPWLAAARDAGAMIKLIELPATPVELVEHVKQSIGSKTRVFMMSHVPCTTGTIYPVAELSVLLREQKVISVFDGAQAVGLTPVALHEIGCDFYTTSGHKWLLGPKESGFVYVSKSAQEFFRPSFVGAYSDTRYELDELILDLRKTAQVNEYGTRNAATIDGLIAAMDFLETIGWQKIYDRQRELARRLISGLKNLVRVDCLTSSTEREFGGIVTFRIRDFPISDLTTKLMRDYRIRVRAITEHKLNACRISLHVFNSPQEVDKLIDAVQEIACI